MCRCIWVIFLAIKNTVLALTVPAAVVPMNVLGTGDDPDKDGLNNLLEYALRSGLMLPNPTPAVPGTMVLNGESYYTLAVRRNPAVTGTIVTVEACGSLVPGDWSATGLIIVANPATGLTVRDSQPLSAHARRFFRARVTR